MNLLQLRYFQAIAKYESVTKAANHYNIPQPAMSQTLARLEKELGNVQLFDRSNNKMTLNENGKIFLEHVDSALSILDNGIASVTSNKTKVSGDIHLLVLDSRFFVSTCVAEFTRQYPEVNFYISHNLATNQVFNYDLCISSNPEKFAFDNRVPLIKEEIALNIHQSHPLAGNKSIRLSELQEEKFITLSTDSSQYELTVSNCRTCGFEPQIPFILDDPYFVRKYIYENLGITLAPTVSWGDRFRKDTLLMHIEEPNIVSTCYLLWSKQRWISKAIEVFREFLLEKSATLEGNLLYSDKSSIDQKIFR